MKHLPLHLSDEVVRLQANARHHHGRCREELKKLADVLEALFEIQEHINDAEFILTGMASDLDRSTDLLHDVRYLINDFEPTGGPNDAA